MITLLMDEGFILYLSTKSGFAPETVRNLSYRYGKFSRWLKDNSLPLDKSSCEKYILYLKEENLTTGTINLAIDLFLNIDRFLEDRGLPLRVSSGFKRYKPEQKHIDILSIREIERITSTQVISKKNREVSRKADKVFLALTCFLAYTGTRFQEANSLLIKDVDRETGRVLIRKSKNGTFRYVYLPLFIVKRIEFLLNGDPEMLVFRTSRNGKILDTNFIQNLRKRALLCGINKRIYPHLFRHSMATQLIIDGVPIESVATILGHKDISTTFGTYVHLADATIKKNMYRHQLFKQNTPPSEIIQGVLESVKSYKLEADKRFHTKLIQDSHTLKIDITF